MRGPRQRASEEPSLPYPPAQLDLLRAALLETFFAGRDPEFFRTAEGQKALDDHLFHRTVVCARHIRPWVERHFPLAGRTVLELGCGTGSVSVCFAAAAGSLLGYDIAERSVAAARRRAEILGVSNVRFEAERPEVLLETVRERHREGVDAVLLYALLEHALIRERLELLRTAWACLKPGGVLIVADTPNRLVYLHRHTSEVPFFDLIPDELKLHFLQRSPRERFRKVMMEAAARSPQEAFDKLDRWGRGVSFHEFEAVLGDLRELVIADGFAPEITARLKVRLEEQLLLEFLHARLPEVPAGFARESLSLILRKPDGSPVRPPPFPEEARLVLSRAAEVEGLEALLQSVQEKLARRREAHEKLIADHQALKEELRRLRP